MRTTELIQTVLNSALSEDAKIYWIQSHLLHWATKDDVLEAVKSATNRWKYGQEMLELGFIDTLDNWNEQKERIFSTMDRVFDYLWEEDEDDTLTFYDRSYADIAYTGLDEQGRERKRNGELILRFKSYSEVSDWINKKLKGSC